MTPAPKCSTWGPPAAPCTTSITTSQPPAPSPDPYWGTGTACTHSSRAAASQSVPGPRPREREVELSHGPEAQLPARKINKDIKKNPTCGEAVCKHFRTAEQPRGTVPFPCPRLALLTQVKSKKVLHRTAQRLRRKTQTAIKRKNTFLLIWEGWVFPKSSFSCFQVLREHHHFAIQNCSSALQHDA